MEVDEGDCFAVLLIAYLASSYCYGVFKLCPSQAPLQSDC